MALIKKITVGGSTYDLSINLTNATGTLGVSKGGTGMTTATYKNAVVIGNSSTVTNAMQTVRTGDGAFYAITQDGKPLFGTLPIAQGGTGATTAAGVRSNLETHRILYGTTTPAASLGEVGDIYVLYTA